jgi:hypothetical protein
MKLAGRNAEKEKEWQTKKLNSLPTDLVAVVRGMWNRKELDRRI